MLVYKSSQAGPRLLSRTETDKAAVRGIVERYLALNRRVVYTRQIGRGAVKALDSVWDLAAVGAAAFDSTGAVAQLGVKHMHWSKKSCIAVAMLTGLATPALAQNNSASVNTSGSTTIAAPITLTQNSTLRFGSLVRPTANSNTVTLATDTCAPALTGSGNAALISSTSGCATYTVGGESGQSFNVTTDPTFAMTRSGGTETITVTLTKSEATGTIGQTSAAFKVGGSFPVDTTTVAGAYTGTFAVTATYQ